MQMKAQRELLDKLLGKDRNLTVCAAPLFSHHSLHVFSVTPAVLQSAEKAAKAAAARANAKKYNLSDPRLCRHFLCGFCPYQALQFTKNDLGLHMRIYTHTHKSERQNLSFTTATTTTGACNKVHDEVAQSVFQSLPEAEKRRLGYEREFELFLRKVLDDMDRKRLERYAQQVAQLQQERAVTLQHTHQLTVEEITARVADIDAQLPPLVASAERLGEEGEVTRAHEAMAQADALRREREQLMVQMKDAVNERRMTTCEVCGALLVVGDTEQRLQAHKDGKQHLAFIQIRDWLAAYDAHCKAIAAAHAATGATATPATPAAPAPAPAASVAKSDTRTARRRSRSRSRSHRRHRRHRSASSSSSSRSRSRSRSRSSSYSSSSSSSSRSPSRSRSRHSRRHHSTHRRRT